MKIVKSFSRFMMIMMVSLSSFGVFAAPRGAQELIPSGHWIYDSLMAISLESGLVNFADSAPISIQELKVYLNEIDYDSLSEAGKADYDRILDYFKEENLSIGMDILSIGIEPSLSLEGYYKSNDDVDWVYNRYEREHLLDMPTTITCGDYFSMSMDVYLGQNKCMASHNDNYSNVPLAADQIDINFPDDGYFSTGKMLTDTTGIGFQIGKGERSIGRLSTGSMIWSENLTGASYAQFEAYNPVFKYTGSVSQFNVDKFMYAHQIDVRIKKRFQLSFFEGLFVNAPMELRFMNPWMVFHGFSPWRDYSPKQTDTEDHTCDYFAIKAQFTPINNLRLYGTFAMTQYQTPFEKANWADDVTPNGLGGQLGAEYYLPVGKGRFRFGLEGSIANPYLYIKESPNWSLVRTYNENIGDQDYFYEWIGSPFGPDTISGEASVSYEVPKKYSIDLKYLFMARGEMSGDSVFRNLFVNGKRWGGQYTDFPYEDGKDYRPGGDNHVRDWCYPDSANQSDASSRQNRSCPTGTPEYVNRLSLCGTLYPNDYLKLKLQPSYVLIFNRNHQEGNTKHSFECVISAKLNFVKM